MSEGYKLKYEVLKILRDNIVKGLESFGLPIGKTQGDGGWRVFEADQPAFRNLDQCVAVWMEGMERVGWQGNRSSYNKETDKFDTYDTFIEQQEWRVRVIYKRNTDEITAQAMPLTSSDVAAMLISWFNRLGCEEFRKHNCANLYIQMKDLQVYKAASDVSQWVSEFPLFLQVPKTFTTEVEPATPKYEGLIGVPIVNKP